MSSTPRRNQVLQWCPAEKAISAAVDAVEAMPADVRLTNAVVLLGRARDSVADFVDSVQSPTSPEEELADTRLVLEALCVGVASIVPGTREFVFDGMRYGNSPERGYRNLLDAVGRDRVRSWISIAGRSNREG